MLTRDERHRPTSDRGLRPSIVEDFVIQSLYGYRNIGLSSQYAATILIAKNGTGKTTLLGALDAFLRLQLGRLRNIEFTSITCKLRAHEQALVLTKEDVISFLQGYTHPEVVKTAARANIEPVHLFNFLIDEWRDHPSYSDISESKVYQSLIAAFSYSYRDFSKIINDLYQIVFSRIESVQNIKSTIETVLKDYDIVYLPTYRRIELSLTDDRREGTSRRRRRPRFNVAAGSLHTGDIQFGLSDISDRLSDLNMQITNKSDEGYREISADIINELIDGSFEQVVESDREIPSEDELRLFFLRLEQGPRIGRYPRVPAPNLKKLYGDKSVPEASSKFLNYFLRKLATVVDTSKAIEAPVDAFIESCNKYLLSEEPSTSRGHDRSTTRPASGKRLKLNRRNLNVTVVSVPEQRAITLDALSSGEKQMISLFAKLFLYPDKKIVLIDEPELSLSIDWQMQILVDVLNAPLCEQVIAITHSPFVFENDLEPFAKSLSVSTNIETDHLTDEAAHDD